MAYDANNQWVPDEAPPQEDYSNAWQDLWNKLRGQQPAGPPALGPSPEEVASAQKIAAADKLKAEEDKKAADATKIVDLTIKQQAATLAKTEADTARLEAAALAETSPEAKAKLQAEADVAKARLLQIQAEIARDAKAMSPEELARLQSELAIARDKAAVTATASESALTREATAKEGELDRQARAREQEANLGTRRDEANQTAGITIRGQEIDRLKAQDTFVVSMLQQQVAEGKLSLDLASKQFDAYVSRARLPSEIMKNVGAAIEPMLPYMTNAKKGSLAPGFEKGGPMQQLVERSGGKYDAKSYARDPVKVDLFDLARQGGADFSKTSVPDVATQFSGVKVPQTNPAATVSALGQTPAASPLLPGLAGSASPGVQPVTPGYTTATPSLPETLVPATPSYAPTNDEMQRMQTLLNGG